MYKLIVIVLLFVILQNNKIHGICIKIKCTLCELFRRQCSDRNLETHADKSVQRKCTDVRMYNRTSYVHKGIKYQHLNQISILDKAVILFSVLGEPVPLTHTSQHAHITATRNILRHFSGQ